MRIGIITQPLSNNYGGLLQNYALQRILERMGHKVITIDQEYSQPPVWRVFLSDMKTLLFKAMGRNREFSFVPDNRDVKYVNQKILRFTNRYINHTEKCRNEKGMREIAQALLLDAYVVGSDQVWRPCYNNDISLSFLSFTNIWQVKRVAYAASFGVDNWEFSASETAKCKALAGIFDAISVREYSGIELCKRYLEVDACQTLDPTMLLDRYDYESLVEMEKEEKSTGSLLCYILDQGQGKKDFIANLSKRLNLLPFSVMPELRLTAKTKKNIDKCVFPSVTEWLRGFMDAKFVVCDSFHGAVFSIIFNKNFVVLANEQRGMARFYSLLEMYGLEERLVTDWNSLDVLTKPINWDRVNEIREKKKLLSIDFLSRSLS